MEHKKPLSKDRQIIAQSQLKLVQDWSVSCDKCLTLKEMVTISLVLADYVEFGYNKEIGERLDKIQDYLENK